MENLEELNEILSNFLIRGDITFIAPFGNGHINKTYVVDTTTNKYILQKINTYAFPNVDMLMSNINIVTSHLRNKGYETLEVISTKKGNLYYKDGEFCYRIYAYVLNSVCHEQITNMESVQKAALAFGDLHSQLSDLDASLLGEVIPCFHNTPKRFNDFKNAVATDKIGRLITCQNEVNDIMSFKDEYSRVVDGIKNKEINLTVTHNDPKINNVLFDAKTDDVRCVIDLDTVMPGSVLYDFGDALRSLFTGCNEDSEDLSLLKVNEELYKNYLYGYASKMKAVLTPKEIELLPYSAFLLTIECGMRFLEDYLKGDVYFHTKYPTHNLVRCRTQITLAKDIFSKFDRLNQITKEVLESL